MVIRQRFEKNMKGMKREMKKSILSLVAMGILTFACATAAFALDVPEGQVVGWGEIDSITTVAGHAVANGHWESQPTCTELGTYLFDCADPTVEEPHQHYVLVKELGHDWASTHVELAKSWGIVDTPPTCYSEGQAHDVCLNCGLENYDVTRVISKIPHTYAAGSYEVVVEPTCTEEGLAFPKCTVCGYVDVDAELIVLPKKPHNFTDWKVVKDPTCAAYGIGQRACIWCGMHQEITEANYTEFDAAAKNWFLKNLSPLNAAWDGTLAPIKAGLVDYVIVKDWDYNCYTREITYQCKWCKGKVHADVKEELPIIAHIWKEEPEEFGETEEFGDAPYSKRPTCTEKGWYLYKCVYDDGVSDAEWAMHHEDEEIATRYKKVELPATGHDWSAWQTKKTYKKDGKDYELQVRFCRNCGLSEEQVVEAGAEAKNGLVYEEGEWRYFENGTWNKAFAGIVEFQGGQFFVADGVVCGNAFGLQLYKDTWYFVSQGQIQTQYTGLALYDGEWFYIENGILDTVRNGLVDYDGSQFLVAAGRIRLDVNGLWQSTDGWVYLSNGQVQDYTGLVNYDGSWFYVIDGKLATDFNGTVKYDGADFKVVAGEVVA